MLIDDKITALSEEDMILSLAWAWKRYYGTGPDLAPFACCLAQMALETGRMKYCHCWNVGNIKKIHATRHTADDGHDWCMFRCSEILGGKEHWFDPPHPQTHFRAYDTAIDGMLGYLKFLVERARYAKAWSQVLAGNPEQFSKELSKAGYYTASEPVYTRNVIRLFKEFSRKSALVLDSEKGLEVYAGENEIERNRVLELANLTAMQSVRGELDDDDGIDEDVMRESITSNLDDDDETV